MLTKEFQLFADFGNFCKDYNLNPDKAAHFLQVARQHVGFQHYQANFENGFAPEHPMEKERRHQEEQKLAQNVRQAAQELGFDVYWPGLYPVLQTQDGLAIEVPNLH